ncbi:MAG: hypothetical protein KatS3mg060_0489 [Dehalococcoidia bacterium]|nr:MAG: hypothetical protein KatS3mg060_0489 [Dehalococcoidia bacterium]
MAPLFRRLLAILALIALALPLGVGGDQPASTAQGVIRRYVPVTMLNDPKTGNQSPLAAVWHKPFGNDKAADRAAESGARYVRAFIEWRNVEPVQTTPPTYNWSQYDTELGNIIGRGLVPMLNLTDAPDWAAFPNCGPFKDANGQARWVEWVKATVARYSAPPYNVRYFILTNEPDFRMKNPNDRNGGGYGGGCWGNNPAAFGAMLRATYSAVKPLYPNVFLVMGPLASDGSNVDFNLNFLQEVVNPAIGNAGNSFDMASFNYFIFYRRNWEQYGTSVIGKAERFRQIMASAGGSKPVIVAETGLVEDELGATAESQAILVPQVFTQALADSARAGGDGIGIATWFSLKDFLVPNNDSDWGLIDVQDNPKPSFRALRQWANEMYNATLKANLSEPTFGTTPPVGARKCDPAATGATYLCDTLQRYLFSTTGARDKLVVWVDPGAKPTTNLYFKTTATRVIQYPANEVFGIRDREGNAVSFPVVGGQVQITVGESPLYIDVLRK